MKYSVIIEAGQNSFGAYVPDLPGCIAVGESKEEVLQLIHEAIEFHLEGLREDGQPIPAPSREQTSDEVLAPFRRQVVESGITDEALDELFIETRRDYYREQSERQGGLI